MDKNDRYLGDTLDDEATMIVELVLRSKPWIPTRLWKT
jgi:hypothetical protein